MQKNNMKILFFPSDIGGGFGHISRCLALAFEAKNRGHECAFLLNKKKYKDKIINEFKVSVIKKPTSWTNLFRLLKQLFSGSKPSFSPLFTEISGLDFQIIRDGFTSEKQITRILDQYIKIVEKFKPDVLIGDTNLLVWILSQKVKIPVVQIVRFAFHPKTARLIWWKDYPEKMIPPDTCALFNPLLLKMRLKPIKKAEDLLQGNFYIVPSISEIEPIPENINTVHVGELTVPIKDSVLPFRFRGTDNSLPLVYITIGGGAGSVGCKLFFSTIIDAFKDKKIQVIVSAGNKFNLSELPQPPENIKLFNWVPGKLMISRADLIVFHGGYGTLMEAVSCGKPSIIIPFHTEQEGNGRRLEKLGCSILMKMSNSSYRQIENKWKFGSYTYLIQDSYDIRPEMLYEKCYEILNNKKYVNAAKALQTKIKKHQGAQKAVDLIENIQP
jgi:UDP:flavonoid glycosyltransferase YjiC (YdhE family)